MQPCCMKRSNIAATGIGTHGLVQGRRFRVVQQLILIDMPAIEIIGYRKDCVCFADAIKNQN